MLGLKRLVEDQSKGPGSVSRERVVTRAGAVWALLLVDTQHPLNRSRCVLDNLWLLHRHQCP